MVTLSPKIGDKFFIPETTYPYSDKGEGDITGGEATVNYVSFQFGDPFVSFEEVPGHSFNYSLLLLEQDKLKKLYGKDKASLSNVGKEKEIARLKITMNEVKKKIDELKSPILSSSDIVSLKAMMKGLERLEKKL